MNTFVGSFRRLVIILALSLSIGAIFILMIGENPIDAYIALLRGAFVGDLNLGKTLANFTPLLLTSLAFAIAAKGGGFNVGVEGEVFLGGIAAAYIGIHWDFLPMPLHLLACFAGAIIVAALWVLIPTLLKVYYRVNEVCSTILLNYVAFFITSFLVSGPMSAGVANSQSLPVAEQVELYQFMKPSSANVGIFIAIAVAALVVWMYSKTTFGFKIEAAGTNPDNAEYVGIDPKVTFIKAMLVSGILGGIAGAIEILGVHGYFLNNFAANLGFNGMLASLIVKNDLIPTIFMAFFLGSLKSGALGLQQTTGVPKSIVDTITATFIIIATMELLFQYVKKKKKEKENQTEKETIG
jgi:ABC-type uncharacterized transport system permease subunit